MSLLKARLAFIIAVLTLSGCGSEDEEKGSGSSLPTLPDDTSAAATIEGVDENNNGIRDEIEHFLHNTYSDTNVRNAYSNFVIGIQNMQASYTANPNDVQGVVNAAVVIDHSIECAYSLLPSDQVIPQIRDLRERMLNTTARVQSYLAADRLLSGEIFPSVDVDLRASSCDLGGN